MGEDGVGFGALISEAVGRSSLTRTQIAAASPPATPPKPGVSPNWRNGEAGR